MVICNKGASKVNHGIARVWSDTLINIVNLVRRALELWKMSVKCSDMHDQVDRY
jgi:hypothetical protein